MCHTRLVRACSATRMSAFHQRIRQSLTCSIITGILIIVFSGCTLQKNDSGAAEDAGRTTKPQIGEAASEWIDHTPETARHASRPAAGEDCSIVYDPIQKRMLLFGGKNDLDENMNEVWELDIHTKKWEKLTISGSMPPPSEDHVTLFDPIGYRLLLHGGENGPTTNKLWALDLNELIWHDLTDSTSPPREDHTAIYDSRRKRMVIFGGTELSYPNIWEIWGFGLDPKKPDFHKWTDLTVEEKHIPGRMDHTAVYDSLKDRMIVYGGWDLIRKRYFEDTWSFSFTDSRWKKIKTKKSHPPMRRHVVGDLDSRRNWFIIFGGFGNKGLLNDAWAFDMNKDKWINITPGPQPRFDHQAVYVPDQNSFMIYGGDAGLSGKFHDLWQLKIRDGADIEGMLKSAR